MPFYKGQPKTPGSGRKTGTPNKSTQFCVDTIQAFLDEYKSTGKMSKDWELLEPRDRITLAERMMAYVMPKRAAVQADVNATVTDPTIEDTLRDLAGE